MGYKEREAARNHRLKADRNERRSDSEDLICECSDLRCNATIQLTPVERGSRHDRPNRFWVKPGHVMITLEHIVAENDRYAVVEGPARAPYVVAGSE
jgi:hypothetical protein